MNYPLHAFIFDVLGLEAATALENNQDSERLANVVELLIQLRAKARANRVFAMGDKIRDELAANGIQLKDSKEGTTFSL